MSNYYFSTKIDKDTILCIAPLSDYRIELSGQEIRDTSGYFLYSTTGDGEPTSVEIIAQLASEEAAINLKNILGLQ